MNVVVGLGLLSVLVACEPTKPLGAQGELHPGTFVYCEQGNDCKRTSLPDAIAVGSTFGLSFSDPSARLSLDGSSVLMMLEDEARAARFRAAVPGRATVTARDSENDAVGKATLTVADPGTLELEQCDGAFDATTSDPAACGGTVVTTLALSLGDSVATPVCLRILDEERAELGGAPDAKWTAMSDTATLAVNAGSDARCATIGALALGDATVSVDVGIVTTSLDVTVDP